MATTTKEVPQSEWAPDSWRNRIAAQQPVYEDQQHLAEVLGRLQRLPPLVTSWEVEKLKQQLAMASRGEAFLLQGGDCSESLENCETDSIVRSLKVLMQMSLVLSFGSLKRIIRVGRIAGQYAKPRSNDTETRDGVTLPVYRGDIVNHSGFTEADRRPNPELLIRGYERAALTLNFIRGLSAGGFADLHHPENWDIGFVSQNSDSPQFQEYRDLVASIGKSLRFVEVVHGLEISQVEQVDYYTSHEGLHLTYEQAQTRRVPRRDGWYNLNTHFPWIGDRTRALDGAHIEYFRGIENPIGVKLGPSSTPEFVTELGKILNPKNERGRLTFIHRFGDDKIEEHLPPLIHAVQKAKMKVLWVSDPMHGNTFAAENGIKTRRVDKIESELRKAFEIHNREGSILGGAHLELTGDDVTECVGGARGLKEEDLHRAYKSPVDPRLNYEQAMEIAFLIAEKIPESSNLKQNEPGDMGL